MLFKRGSRAAPGLRHKHQGLPAVSTWQEKREKLHHLRAHGSLVPDSGTQGDTETHRRPTESAYGEDSAVFTYVLCVCAGSALKCVCPGEESSPAAEVSPLRCSQRLNEPALRVAHDEHRAWRRNLGTSLVRGCLGCCIFTNAVLKDASQASVSQIQPLSLVSQPDRCNKAPLLAPPWHPAASYFLWCVMLDYR